MEIKYEDELYEPVKIYLQGLGYCVKAEVKDCDVVATKEDELIIVELKKSFSLKLLYQALDRLSVTPNVYVCIPRPKSLRAKSTKSMMKVLKELKIGLIFVGIDGKFKSVDIVLLPDGNGKVTNKGKRAAILKESQGQHAALNIGGSSSNKRIITAFREKSVAVLCLIEKTSQIKLSQMREIDEYKDLTRILQSNCYGWFERVSKGTYKLAPKGEEFLFDENYLDLIEFYRDEVKKYNV